MRAPRKFKSPGIVKAWGKVHIGGLAHHQHWPYLALWHGVGIKSVFAECEICGRLRGISEFMISQGE